MSSHDGEPDALGCVEVRRGALLTAWARDADAREALEIAAQAVSQLFSPPAVDDGDDAMPREVIVVSRSAIHAFARCEGRPGCVAVGIVRGGEATLGLLLASLRTMTGGDR
jgi:hypothetical protein